MTQEEIFRKKYGINYKAIAQHASNNAVSSMRDNPQNARGNPEGYIRARKQYDIKRTIAEYAAASKRRGSRDPKAKLDLTDQLLQQIALADYNRTTTGRTKMSTFLGKGPIGQTAPNLATQTLLGGY